MKRWIAVTGAIFSIALMVTPVSTQTRFPKSGYAAGAQSGDPSIRVLDVKKSAMQQEVGRLAQAGFAIVVAHLAPPGLFTAQTGMLIAQRDEEIGGQREAGYRLLPHTLTHGMKGRGLAGEFAGRYYCAIFEKLPMDDAVRQYMFVKEPTAGDLEKKAHTSGDGLVPVAIDTHGMAAGVFERQAQGGPWKILATTQKGTMERAPTPGATAYRVVGAARVSTMEKELLRAAADGFRILAATVGYGESVVVLAKPTGAPTTTAH